MTAPAMQLSPNLITCEMGVVLQSCKLRQSIQADDFHCFYKLHRENGVSNWLLNQSVDLQENWRIAASVVFLLQNYPLGSLHPKLNQASTKQPISKKKKRQKGNLTHLMG